MFFPRLHGHLLEGFSAPPCGKASQVPHLDTWGPGPFLTCRRSGRQGGRRTSVPTCPLPAPPPPVLGDGAEPVFECFSPAEALDAWKQYLPGDKASSGVPGLQPGAISHLPRQQSPRTLQSPRRIPRADGDGGRGERQGILTASGTIARTGSTTCPTMSQGPAPARQAPPDPRPLTGTCSIPRKKERFVSLNIAGCKQKSSQCEQIPVSAATPVLSHLAALTQSILPAFPM